MPTKKPRVQALINEDIYETFKEICKIEDRSESNMAGKIIADYVKNYAIETMKKESAKTKKNEIRKNLFGTKSPINVSPNFREEIDTTVFASKLLKKFEEDTIKKD